MMYHTHSFERIHIYLAIAFACWNVIESAPLVKTISCSEGSSQRLSDSNFQLNSVFSNSYFQMNCEITPNSHTPVLKLDLETFGVTVDNSPFSQKSSLQTGGEIHLLVVDNNGQIIFRKDFQNASALAGDDKYLICPGLDDKIAPSFGIVTIGNIGHRFVGHLVDSNMTLGEKVSVLINKENEFNLLAFEIGSEIKRQFQVTAVSDEDTPCRLTVSMGCYAAQGSYQDDYSSIGLTFSKFGRITLSSASKPALSSGHWFIGIQPVQKPASDEWSKKINVVAEYGYNNKDRPVLYAALLSFFGGLFVAIFAHFFLNPQLDSSDHDELDGGGVPAETTNLGVIEENINHTDPATTSDSEIIRSADANAVQIGLDNTDGHHFKRLENENEETPEEHYHPTVTPAPSITGIDEKAPTFYNEIPMETKNVLFPKPVFLLKVIVLRWFKYGEKTFSYTTGIMAISLLVGTMQFLIASWSKMYDTGNRDICFYNEACYRPLENYDIPYNLIISNLAYCLHGIILAVAVGVREAIAIQTKTKCDFSIAYAFAWTLSFEGLFSSFYHLCPSRQTFQFDSAFMFVISGLVVVALFNARVKIQNEKYKIDDRREPYPKPVNSSKFFLFFICPLLLLNYLGSMRDTTGLPAFGDAVFWIFLISWMLFIYSWAVYKLQINYWRCKPVCKFKWAMMLFFVPILIIAIGFAKQEDWSQFFLFSCIAGSGLAIFGDFITKVLERYGEYKKHQNSKEQKAKLGKFLDKAYFNIKVFLRILYFAALGVCWVFAIYYFIFLPVTKKTSTPDYSRSFNKDCVFFNYYDAHDLWHILSSFALLMSSFLLLYIT